MTGAIIARNVQFAKFVRFAVPAMRRTGVHDLTPKSNPRPGNRRDFPAHRLAPCGLTAQHPWVFSADRFAADPEAVLAAVRVRSRPSASVRGPRADIHREPRTNPGSPSNDRD